MYIFLKPGLKGIFSILVFLLLSGCSVTQKQQKGYVVPQTFDSELKFTTIKSVIILPVKINGAVRNFIFDTGADLTLIQRDSVTGKRSSFTGASKRKVKLGSEVVESLKIGNADFKNTLALNADLSGLKEQIPGFGGLIGQPVIRKANWLIDYPEKTLRLSNADLADASFTPVKIKRKGGAPYTLIEIDGKKYEVIIDFGSSSAFNVPEGSKLAKVLPELYRFMERQRERYTLGGLQTVKEKTGTVPKIKLSGVEFKDVPTTINTSSQLRIGFGFFRDCVVYIDNRNGVYRIKKKG